MSRTLTWICFTVGVFLGRLLPAPWPLSLGTTMNIVISAALVLLLHWALNRRWRRWWPGGLEGCDESASPRGQRAPLAGGDDGPHRVGLCGGAGGVDV